MQCSVRLDWVRHPTGRWSRFAFIDPQLANVVGVFVVWKETGATVWVGQGNVRDEIVKLRDDPRVTRFGSESLLIAWARVDSSETRNRADRYLAETLNPQVPAKRANVAPLRVNTPNL